MKLPTPLIASFAFAATAFAGETIVSSTTHRVYESRQTNCNTYNPCVTKNAGIPGAYFRANVSRNAVILINDTPNFVTFFVYSADICGPNDVNAMIGTGAQVYEVVVPPYQTSFTDRRGRYFWVGSKLGRWGIDPSRNQIAHL